MVKLLVFAALVFLVLSKSFKIVGQNRVGLVETLGKYSKQVGPGLTVIIPFVQSIRSVSMAMTPSSLPGYSIITKDNAEIEATVTLNFHVTDAYKYTYENTDSVESMGQLVRGHLRDIMGNLELNEALVSTKQINVDLADAIGDLNDVYGIKVDRINIDELKPSSEIQKAMDKQLTADRNKTAAILKAEGDAKSIELRTKANNEAMIKTAEANAESLLKTNRAQAEALETMAEAKAKAVEKAANAENYRILKLQNALSQADDMYLTNQSIEAYKELANSKANMVVVDGKSNDFGKISALGKILKSNDTDDLEATPEELAKLDASDFVNTSIAEQEIDSENDEYSSNYVEDNGSDENEE